MVLSGAESSGHVSSQSIVPALGFYVLFGTVHELAHLASFILLSVSYSNQSFAEVFWHLGFGSAGSGIKVLLRALLGRYCILPTDGIDKYDDPTFLPAFILTASRHVGWISSILIAIGLHFLHNRRGNGSSARSSTLATCKLAAYATAIEALSTDLLGLVPHSPSSYAATTALFCGNFGVILLNSKWLTEDGGKAALNVMEKMVNVTMMRGAQCGGVVTFEDHHKPSGGGAPDMPQLTGLRSRVVNSKRTDLSKGIRKKVEKDACNPLTGKLRGSDKGDKSFVGGFYGHTRFATTSKVTFDGTHPHQWTPRTKRSVYYPFSSKPTQKAAKHTIYVENFITHNGDLDFYQINGKNYDLGAIQGWLVHATGAKMPTSVDSCAIAGLVDLLRTQGCFALSARYAVSFGLSTSKIEANPIVPLPIFQEFERIGMIFEKELDDMLPSYNDTLDDIATNKEARFELVKKVYDKIKPEFQEVQDNMVAEDR